MVRNRLHTALTVGIAIAIATGAAVGVSEPASADIVDTGRLGSITIHRFEMPPVPTGLPANGSPVDTTGLAPVEDVEYLIRRVSGVDLATAAGWSLAQTAATAFDPADPTGSLLGVSGITGLGAAITVVTDATGTATSGPIGIGLYLITEGTRPPGVQPAVPVVVSVPLTDPDSGDWRYDVHIYPKSAVFGLTKGIDDADLVTIGDEVEYTISADIPNDPPLDLYRILDTLDARLGYLDAIVLVSDGTPIVEGTDYLTSIDASNVLTIEFTAAGRTALLAAAGSQVEVHVTAIVEGTGIIENQASLDLDGGVLGGLYLSAVIETRLGSAVVRKVDDHGVALAGAVFAVYRTEADARADQNRIELGAQTSFTTGISGQITLDGLRYSDFSGGASVAAGQPGYRTYWLGEVTAPAGYRPLGAPIEFEINSSTTAGSVVLEVENLTLTGGPWHPILAFTGFATGGTIIAAGALIAGGILFVLLPAIRRRQRARASL